MDIAQTITDLANTSGEWIQVQCIIHPDWDGKPHWRVYVGMQCLGSRQTLPEAMTEAGLAIANERYSKEG